MYKYVIIITFVFLHYFMVMGMEDNLALRRRSEIRYSYYYKKLKIIRESLSFLELSKCFNQEHYNDLMDQKRKCHRKLVMYAKKLGL